MALLIGGFGSEQKALWNEFAASFDGSIADGGKYNGDTLLFKHKNWTIVLDECLRVSGSSSRRVTRMRLPIVNKTSLCFKIFKEDFFLRILKIFGAQDIEIGDPVFDKAFMIEGNQESTIIKLLESSEIKSILLAMPGINYSLRTDEEKYGDEFPEGIDLLEVDLVGKVDSIDVLRFMAILLISTCKALEKIDPTFGEDPNLTLI